MASETVPLDSKCLYLLNNVTVDGNGPYPITQAYFDNCTIDGSYDVELKADGSTDFDYRFNHCALKAKEPPAITSRRSCLSKRLLPIGK